MPKNFLKSASLAFAALVMPATSVFVSKNVFNPDGINSESTIRDRVCTDSLRNMSGLLWQTPGCLDQTRKWDTLRRAAKDVDAEIAKPSKELALAVEESTAWAKSLLLQANFTVADSSSSAAERKSAQYLLDNPGLAKLQAVDSYVNRRIGFASDEESFGVRDKWLMPSETLAGDRGDCEDYAILKGAMLRLMGWPADKVWLSYGKAKLDDGKSREAHMVLVAGYGQTSYVLDNLNNHTSPGLPDMRDKQQNDDFQPLFMFNSKELLLPSRPETPADTPRASSSFHGLRLDFLRHKM